MATALVSVLIIGASSFVVNATSMETGAFAVRELSNIRTELTRVIQDESAMSATIAGGPPAGPFDAINSAAFACLASPNPCTTSTREIKIFDSNGNRINFVTLSSEANLGISRTGATCNTFDAVNGNDRCPFKYTAQWTPVCTGVSCANPIIQLKINLVIKAKNANSLKLGDISKFDINYVRAQVGSDTQELCKMFNPAAIVAPDGTCSIPHQGPVVQSCSTACPSNSPSFVQGFNADGTIKCAPCAVVAKTGCGQFGKVLLKINIDGTVVCADGQIPNYVASGAIHNPTVPYAPAPPPAGGGRGGGGCFVRGTPVLMADGSYKAIDHIKVGDEVINFNEDIQKMSRAFVTHIFHHPRQAQTLHRFQMADGREFTSNAIHPIYIFEKSSWQTAEQIYKELQSGEKLSLLDFEYHVVQIVRISIEKKDAAVFNLEVEGNRFSYIAGQWGRGHNYFVNGFLVHNYKMLP